MPVISGSAIAPRATKRASDVIDAMITLRRLRFHNQISRRKFLAQWRKLRVALRLTHDYSNLRDLVTARSKGKCEECRSKAFVHLHHIVPVAINPRMALIATNVLGVCLSCHKRRDARDRIAALRAEGGPGTASAGSPKGPEGERRPARTTLAGREAAVTGRT